MFFNFITFNNQQRAKSQQLRAKGQTAIELAVFGAILIFMIASIVRQAMQFSYQQNHQLKAMRMAMKLSFESSEGLRGINPDGKGNSARNSASVFVVEDRLESSSGKYASVDRFPLVSLGSATHSRNLLLPIDAGEDWNMRIADFFINGKHFPFTTEAFSTVCLRKFDSNGAEIISHCKPGDKIIGELRDWSLSQNPPAYCVSKSISVCEPKNCHPQCLKAPLSGCSTNSPDYILSEGCLYFYTVIPNHPSMDYDPQAIVRFNLDRDVNGVADVPEEMRESFSWQWFANLGVNEAIEGVRPIGGEGVHVAQRRNVAVDIDGDFKEELIESIIQSSPLGVIERMYIRDFQDGDLDFTTSEGDVKPSSGMTNNVDIYTKIKAGDGSENGTYLLLEEGKLYSTGPNGQKQFVRSAQKKDHVDVITRIIQLSNDTGRFCDNGVRVPKVDGEVVNPVEACGNCFSAANLEKTCFEPGNVALGEYPKIYVRSRILDRRGRKWETDISDDPYVNFQTPEVGQQ